MIFWLTGQPGAGKTTIAKELLRDRFKSAFLVDGDQMRELFNNKDYSEKGRRDNIELAQNIAYYLNQNNRDVIVAMVSPYRDQREAFKEKVGGTVKEYYIHTSEIRGKENYHTNYEQPLTNFIDIDTTKITVSEICNIFFS
jgi:adenylylsulfate kinase